MKSLYKMTDDEVIGMVMESSNISFALNNKSGNFNLQGCVNLAKEEIAKYFKKCNGLWAYATLDSVLADELSKIQTRYEPLLWDVLREKRAKVVKRQTITTINFARAKAVISGALSVTGLPFSVYEQQYRAQVVLNLAPRSTLFFYVNYKDVDKEGKMEEMVAAVNSLRLAAKSLGCGTMLKRR